MHRASTETAARPRSARRRLLAGLAVAGVVAGGAGAAHARVELVRWRQPAAEPAEGFRVHVGTESNSYEDVLDLGSLVASDEGVYAVAVAVPDDFTVYVAVSAYNDAGESDISNESERVPGADEPAAEGRRGIALAWSGDAELHAALDPRKTRRGAGLELRGSLRIDDGGAGVGVTLRDRSDPDAFYWLGRDPAPGAAFTVASTVSTLECVGALPAPVAGAWYRFRFAARAHGRRTVVAAKVWEEGTPEPSEWATCTDASASRLAKVVPGLWSAGAGTKAWDGIRTRRREN